MTTITPNRISNNGAKWPGVSPEHPCPTCGRTNKACKIAPDGGAVVCFHSCAGDFQGKVRQLNRNGNGQHSRPDPTPTPPKKTFLTAEAALEAATPPGGKLVTTWKYPDDTMRVARFNLPDGAKQFRPVHKLDNGAWAIGDPPVPLPLYRGDEIPADGPLYVCEGEKCADLARELGLSAVTSAHGSAAPHKSNWTPLAGRDVVILPDFDTAGQKYAKTVAEILIGLKCRVKIAKLPDLPPGGDIVDFDAEIAGSAEATRTKIEQMADAVSWMDATAAGPQVNNLPACDPLLVNLRDVEPRRVPWIWKDRIPLARLSMIVGTPGAGKTFCVSDISARITRGLAWPDGSPCEAGDVLFLSGEDDPHDQIRPRHDACGADVSRVHLLSMVRKVGENGKTFDVMFTLADVMALEIALQRIPNCRLVVVDPIGSFLGGAVDMHRDNEVRSVLAPLAKLAEKFSVAILLIAHRRKATSAHADDTALGSRAFTGLCRAVWHLSRDRDRRERRLLLPGKCNLSAEPTGLAFTIEGDPARIVWESDAVEMTADDAMAAEESRPSELRADVQNWLRGELADMAEHAVKSIREDAGQAGFHWRSVQRAREEIGAIVHRSSFGGAYVWRLPKPALGDNTPQVKTHGTHGTQGKMSGTQGNGEKTHV